MASGIKDKVAIIGMGCSRFGERWDCGTEHLVSEAFQEALQDAGIERKQIEAAWFGSCLDKSNVGNSAIPLSTALRLEGIPVTRVENMCATGTEALRGAVYAVAAGAADIALAIGAEKLKDTGYGGLPVNTKGTLNDLIMPYSSAPAGFAQLAAGYRARYGTSREELKRAIGRVSWKSHQNGAKNPKARDHPQGADDCRSTGSVRLLRCERRRGLRDRDDPGYRPRTRQKGPSDDQGAAALAQRGP
jgi:acetyl-CoA C-acetyltransferase